jgi:hypothetical protein
MTNKDGRPIEFGEQLRHNVGITLGTEDATGRRRSSETGQVWGQCRQSRQALLEIGTTAPPPVQGENAWRPLAEGLGKNGAVSKRAQSQRSILDLKRRNAENTGSNRRSNDCRRATANCS